jgi:UDP-N-acetylglucosamine 3-dehydrogenase
MAKELGCGIIGCGGIAAMHADAISKTPGVRIVAVHDVNAEARLRGAETSGCPGFSDLDEMLGVAGMDFVIVATPPAFHAQCAIRAIERGLHVLCEKPVAMNLAEAEQMVARAGAKGVRLIPAFCHRHAASTKTMRAMIADGSIGDLLLVRNQFQGRALQLLDTWFTRRELSGGGVVMDTLVHSIDLFHSLAGYTASAGAAMASKGFGLEVEDTAVLTLVSESGAVGTLTGSWAVGSGRAEIEVFGSKGSLLFDYFLPDRVVWQKEDGTREAIGVENAGERFVNQMRHLAGLLGGTVAEPLVGERDAVESMRVVDMVYGRV